MKAIFVYAPRSGDRVFACRPTAQVRVVGWSNGCRHVMGAVHLRYFAAAQGREYWRAEAGRTARALIEALGGVAWDECGTIHLAVCPSNAFAAHEIMQAAAEACGVTRPADRVNEAAMVMAGAAVWDASLGLHQAWVMDDNPDTIPEYAGREPVSVEGGAAIIEEEAT